MRVWDDGRRNSDSNMAIDAELFGLAEAGEAAVRVYRWSEPWVTVGCFQNPERDLLPASPVGWSRRPTGGKAVLHGHDETVCIALPLGLLAGLAGPTRDVKAIYRALCAPLVEALNACGLSAALGEETPFVGRGERTGDCFAKVSPNDIVDPVTGVKVCGCALKVSATAVVLQASIPNGLPLVDPALVFARPAPVSPHRWEGDRLAEALERTMSLLEAVRMTT